MSLISKLIVKSNTRYFAPIFGCLDTKHVHNFSFREPKRVAAEEAVKHVACNQRLLIHEVAMAPKILINALVDRAKELKNVEIVHIHTEGPAPYTEPQYADSFKSINFFVGSNTREAVQRGQAEFVPIFLSEISSLFSNGILPLDVAFIQISPPDQHGYCTYGTAASIVNSGVDAAKLVIAQINKHVPRTFGHCAIHINNIDFAVEHDEPLPTYRSRAPLAAERAIGKHVAALVENEATLQLGIGAIPDACLTELVHHKDLGVHTEMFSDGMMHLFASGALTGSKKKIFKHKIVTSFAMGSQKLYDFMHENQGIEMMPSVTVNDPGIIKMNDKVTAINSAVEIDLTGQICADSIGSKIYSGVGGQMDFMRGAALSKGGKPIIALTSTTAKGRSKIVPTLQLGAGVVTTRAHVHHVVTEFGAVDLYGKSLQQRARSLINIAHPNHREQLEKEAFELFGSLRY